MNKYNCFIISLESEDLFLDVFDDFMIFIDFVDGDESQDVLSCYNLFL